MKQLLRLLTATVMVGFAIPSFAATAVVTLNGASTTNNAVITNATVKVTSIVIANSSGITGTFKFFDSPDGAATFARGSFDTITSYQTNIVTTYTNFSGIIQTNTNTARFSYTTTIAAATNLRSSPLTATVPTASTYTWTNFSGEFYNMGLLITNQLITNATVTITYIPN